MPKVTALRKARVPFDPVDYAWNVAHGPGLAPCKVRKADMPVTLADHEAAEREARKPLDERLEGRNEKLRDSPRD